MATLDGFVLTCSLILPKLSSIADLITLCNFQPSSDLIFSSDPSICSDVTNSALVVLMIFIFKEYFRRLVLNTPVIAIGISNCFPILEMHLIPLQALNPNCARRSSSSGPHTTSQSMERYKSSVITD